MMGLSRSTFYDQPRRAGDDTALVEAMHAIKDEFEAYLDTHGGRLGEKTREKLLFWYVQSAMWGRFSASTESGIDKDLGIFDQNGGDLDKLIAELRLSPGGLRVEPGHFHSWSVGARFYPVLYMLTRMTEARDWGTGLPLKSSLLGKMNKLEVHHIFPRARLYEADYARSEVNALANSCFLTKDTNLAISDRKCDMPKPRKDVRLQGGEVRVPILLVLPRR